VCSYTRVGFYDRVFAAGYDWFQAIPERAGQAEMRGRTLADAHGSVVELGAGTGLNLRHYPTAVEEVVLTEPTGAMAQRLERQLARSGRRGLVVRAPAEVLPFEDDSFDTATCVFVLCTVADPAQALAEVNRVLRPGGRFLFMEHVQAPEPGLARWQDRLHDPWFAFANGCHCNRPTTELLESSPLQVERVERGRLPMQFPLVKPYALGSAVATP
jgi:ubiquinone/menaquinone biosynthesis C-methylase UbiE